MNISDGLLVAGQKALDLRSTKIVNNKSVPFTTVAEAKTEVPSSKRHIGLIVNVAGVLYWWKAGILDADLVKLDSRPYKSLVAVLTNAGATVPSSVVPENTLPNPTITREDVGQYRFTFAAGTLTVDKTLILCSPGNGSGDPVILYGQRFSDTYLMLWATDMAGQSVDSFIAATIEIRVYN